MITRTDIEETIGECKNFCGTRGMIEINPNVGLCILTSCKKPETIRTSIFSGLPRPVPQAGQMWAEYELLTHPQRDLSGTFWSATSSDGEPVFEFAVRGGVRGLKEFEVDLLEHLGFDPTTLSEAVYDSVAAYNAATEVDARMEAQFCKEKSVSALFLTSFPMRTNPFWNTERLEITKGGTRFSQEVKVVSNGTTVIDSRELTCDKGQMREEFMRDHGKRHAEPLFDKFRRRKVLADLVKLLKLDLFPRSSGSVYLSPLVSALKVHGTKRVAMVA